MEPIVRKVQEPLGYSSYPQYEEGVRSVIDRAQQSIATEMEAKRYKNAEGLTKASCDLQQMLSGTAICKAVRGKHDWNALRMLILHTNGWTGGPDIATASFAERAKELNIFHKLYSGTRGMMGEADDPFGRGSAFDGGRGYEGPDRRRCRYCKQLGHIARNCPLLADRGGKGGKGERRCFRCGKPGHVAADCDGQRVPREEQ